MFLSWSIAHSYFYEYKMLTLFYNILLVVEDVDTFV